MPMEINCHIIELCICKWVWYPILVCETCIAQVAWQIMDSFILYYMYWEEWCIKNALNETHWISYRYIFYHFIDNQWHLSKCLNVVYVSIRTHWHSVLFFFYKVSNSLAYQQTDFGTTLAANGSVLESIG